MLFPRKALTLLTLLSIAKVKQVLSHGTETRYCLTNDNKLRIFVMHWHDFLSNPSEAGTLSIQDVNTGVTTALIPNGLINDTARASLASAGNCQGTTAPVLATSCIADNNYVDWVYFDFPTGCGTLPTYTLLQGNTVVLEEGCANLYPATISLADACVGFPQAKCQDVSVSSDANTCSANVAAASIDNGSTDPDGDNLTFSVGGETSSIYSVGANLVSLVVSDGTFTDSCSATVTVVDNIAPTLICKDTHVEASLGSVSVADVFDSASDICGMSEAAPAITTNSKTSFTCNDVGTQTTVTVEQADVNGNVGQCSAVVTVVDNNSFCNSPPNAVCGDVQVFTDANTCSANVAAASLDNGSTDPDGDNLTFSVGGETSSIYSLGANPVTLVVSDGTFTDSCSATVTVVNAKPVVSVNYIDPILVEGSAGLFSTNGDLSATATDGDNASLSYAWTTDCIGASIENSSTLTAAKMNIASGTEPALCHVSVAVSDTCSTVQESALVVIVDPSAGFVTGGGWFESPSGAYRADTDAQGKANFGFVSKYKKGQSVPSGNTLFQFQSADFSFKSTAYEWLVITGSDCAKFKGEGVVDGSSDEHGFMLTACDNGEPGENDTFRIKIWKKSGETLVYDNMFGTGAGDDSYTGTMIGGGNIQIHQQGGDNNPKKKNLRA